MARENEITTSFNVDISELKRGIQEAQRQIRLANAEFKAAASGMDEWDNSAEGIQAKLKQLKSVLESQNKILKTYNDQLAAVTAEQGEGSRAADELKIKIANQQAAINNTTKDIAHWEEALDHVDDEVDELDKDLDSTTNGGLNAFSVAMGNLASNIIGAVVDKLKDVAMETIEVGKSFDTSMSKVAALSGSTDEELAKLRDTAKEFGSTTQFSASQAADALGYMALAGWDAETSMDALGGVLDLAAASGMDLASASDMVTDYMSAFSMEAEKSAYFADLMAYAQANANTNVEQLGGAFKNCAANMNAAGQDIETTTSLIAMMANQGLKGEQAGTALSAVMRDLTKSMDEGKIAIGDTNIEVMDSEGNYRDLTDILKDVEAATKGMGDAEKASALSATFTADSIKGLNLILNAGVGNAADFEDALRGCEGSAKSMADIMNDNLGGDLTALGSKLEGVQIALYEKFEPAFRSGIDVLSAFLDGVSFLTDHSGEVVGALAAIGAAVGTYIAYTTAVKVMTEGWAALTIVTKAQAAAQAALNVVMEANPIGLIIAAIAALVAGFITLWNTSEDFRNFWINLWNVLVTVIKGYWDIVSGVFKGAWDFLVQTWEGLSDFFSGLWDQVVALFSGIAKWIDINVFQPIMRFFQPVIRFFSDSFAAILSVAERCWTAIKNVWSVVKNWFKTTVIDPVTKIFSDAFTAISDLGDKCWTAIKNVWSAVSGWFKDVVVEPVKRFFTELWSILTELAQGCWEAVKAIWAVVSGWFSSNVIEPIKRVFADLWTGIKSAAAAAWDGIKSVWTAVGNWFRTSVVEPIKGFFADLWTGIQTAASNAWDGIKSAWSAVGNWFKTSVVEPVKGFFSGMWDNVGRGASDAWTAIKEAFGAVTTWFEEKFSAAWQAVKNVFSAGGEVFRGIQEGISAAFKTIVNALISGINTVIAVPFNAINSMLDKIRTVEIAGIKPFEGLITKFTVPQIPLLASGGVLRRGEVGLLEGSGAEAVVPLENNRRWIAATAAALKSALVSEGVVGIHNGVTNNYSFVQNNTSPKALSRLEIYRMTQNQLNFAKGV